MRNKTYKLQKLEKSRYSILTDDMEHCFICKSPFVDIHEIYSAGNRKTSMKNGFCVGLCRSCHTQVTLDYEKNLYLKKKCQLKFEETHSREEFLSLIKRNYL